MIDKKDILLETSTQNQPTIRTETLPEGAFFIGPDDVLYQVVMAGSAGFRKAEPWPWLSKAWDDAGERPSAVALVEDSPLSRNYPIVTRGIPLPPVGRRDFTLPDGAPSQYVFPGQPFARLAAQLDAALASQSGLTVRQEQGCWTLGDGKTVFRIYHYPDATEQPVHPSAQPCAQGPDYWQYIPTWSEATSKSESVDTTLALESQPTESAKQYESEDADVEKSLELKSRRDTMILSIDIGYGYTKGVGTDGLHFAFPSVIGTAEDIRFSTDLIRGGDTRPVKYGDWRFFYGEQAVLQSRVQSAIFNRSRVHDDTYKMLFVASLVELSDLMPDVGRLRVVTGLPVDFFGDRPAVIESFEGIYRITATKQMEIAVESVVVTPQPFGSLFRELLNDNGKIANTDVEKGRVGVIDIGTYTTDFVVSDELRYVQRLSGSVSIGWSKVVSQVQQALADQYMLELTPYEVDQAIQEETVRVRGETVSLGSMIAPATTDIKTAIIARSRDLWGAGVNLDMILVSGGGAPHLYDAIRQVYPHARLVTNAFWANAEGFYRFGQRPATFDK